MAYIVQHILIKKLYFKHISYEHSQSPRYFILKKIQQVVLCGTLGVHQSHSKSGFRVSGLVNILGQPAETISISLSLQHTAHENLHRPQIQLLQ